MAAGKKLVWVVDDEQSILAAVKDRLESNDFNAATFTTAEDAVKALSRGENLPALIITDNDTRSAMTGMDVIQSAVYKKIPIIIQALNDISTKVQSSGAYGFVPKTGDYRALMIMVNQAIGGK